MHEARHAPRAARFSTTRAPQNPGARSRLCSVHASVSRLTKRRFGTGIERHFEAVERMRQARTKRLDERFLACPALEKCAAQVRCVFKRAQTLSLSRSEKALLQLPKHRASAGAPQGQCPRPCLVATATSSQTIGMAHVEAKTCEGHERLPEAVRIEDNLLRLCVEEVCEYEAQSCPARDKLTTVLRETETRSALLLHGRKQGQKYFHRASRAHRAESGTLAPRLRSS